MKYFTVSASALVLSAGFLNAATFTDVSLYNLSSGSQTVIDFEGFVSDTAFSSLTPSLTLSGVTFSVSSGNLGVAGANSSISGSPFDSAILFSNHDQPITASFGTGVFSVAGNFGDISGTTSNASVSIFGTSGLLESFTFVAPDLAPGSPGAFVGFTSSQEITSLVFDGVYQWEGLDNFSFGGTGSVAPVPLPASFPLLAAGMIGMGTLARRRNKST